MAQSFRVQCPTSTITHPSTLHDNNSEPAYTGPTTLSAPSATTFQQPTANVNGAIKCQKIGGGDGYATMGDGTQTYLFSFGPLSGLADITQGRPGTEFPIVFNSPFVVGDQIVIGQGVAGTDLAGYTGTFTVTAVNVPNAFFPNNYAFQYTNPNTGLAEVTESPDGTASSAPALDGHVDARQIMDVGVMNGNIPAPLMAIDEDDEFFLTLTNVGMIMRPDLFEQHTVHFHGYPNASPIYDGVPDASVAINIA